MLCWYPFLMNAFFSEENDVACFLFQLLPKCMKEIWQKYKCLIEGRNRGKTWLFFFFCFLETFLIRIDNNGSNIMKNIKSIQIQISKVVKDDVDILKEIEFFNPFSMAIRISFSIPAMITCVVERSFATMQSVLISSIRHRTWSFASSWSRFHHAESFDNVTSP